GLRKPLRARLRRVRKTHADAGAVAKQTHEAILVLRRRNDQNLADAGEHQDRERIIDQRLVIDCHQLFAGGDGDGVEARTRAASPDDAFHATSPWPSSLSTVADKLLRKGRGLMPKTRSSFAVLSTE